MPGLLTDIWRISTGFPGDIRMPGKWPPALAPAWDVYFKGRNPHGKARSSVLQGGKTGQSDLDTPGGGVMFSARSRGLRAGKRRRSRDPRLKPNPSAPQGEFLCTAREEIVHYKGRICALRGKYHVHLKGRALCTSREEIVHLKGRGCEPQGKKLCTSREIVFSYPSDTKGEKVEFGVLNYFQ